MNKEIPKKPEKKEYTKKEGMGYLYYQSDREYVDTFNETLDLCEAYRVQELEELKNDVVFTKDSLICCKCRTINPLSTRRFKTDLDCKKCFGVGTLMTSEMFISQRIQDCIDKQA